MPKGWTPLAVHLLITALLLAAIELGNSAVNSGIAITEAIIVAGFSLTAGGVLFLLRRRSPWLSVPLAYALASLGGALLFLGVWAFALH